MKSWMLLALLGLTAGCGESDEWVARTASPYQAYASETHMAGPKDVCIVTHFTSNMDTYALDASDNHQAYAWRHGYKTFAYRGRISGDQFIDPDNAERLRHDGLYWQKIAAVQRLLAQRATIGDGPFCQWVMWIDADAIFTNFERSIESILAQYPGKDVVLAREYFDTFINAGVFFVNNSEQGRSFIDNVAGMFDVYKDEKLPEQQAMQDYALQRRIPLTPKQKHFEAYARDLRPEIVIAAQRTFNSFANASVPSDLVAHLAGTKGEKRKQRMQHMMDTRAVCAP
jgi:hypothetical protein